VAMGSDKYRLNWKEFDENTRSYFRELRVNEEHADLSLACEDGQQFDVHKIVLSACSPFFQMMLRRNQHQHPLIYMRGMKSDDLASILDFMYFGEIEMSQVQLPEFLAVAEELKLKGLTPDRANGGSGSGFVTPGGKRKRRSSVEEVTPAPVEGTPEQFVCEPSTGLSDSRLDEEQEVASPPRGGQLVGLIDPEDMDHHMNTSIDTTINTTMEPFNPENPKAATLALEDKIESMINKQGDGVWICKVCGKTITGRQAKGNMKQHVETHIEGIQHSCTTCGKTYKNRNSLHTHISMKHRSTTPDSRFKSPAVRKSEGLEFAYNYDTSLKPEYEDLDC